MKNLFRAESVVVEMPATRIIYVHSMLSYAAMFFNRNEHQNIIHFAAANIPATSHPIRMCVCVSNLI